MHHMVGGACRAFVSLTKGCTASGIGVACNAAAADRMLCCAVCAGGHYARIVSGKPPFEELALLLVEAGEPEALQVFLQTKLQARTHTHGHTHTLPASPELHTATQLVVHRTGYLPSAKPRL
jgi:hypothetical protein